MIAKCIVLSMIGVLAASTAVQAQQVGTYTGTTQDGSAVTITVAQDPNNDNLEIKVISFDINALCQKSLETLNYIGIGFNDGSDIVNGQFSYASSGFFDVDLVTAMTFQGTQTVKGKVGVNFAAFNPALGHQTLINKVQVCVSPKQPFTATFSGPKGGPDLAPGTIAVHGPGGSKMQTFSVRP